MELFSLNIAIHEGEWHSPSTATFIEHIFLRCAQCFFDGTFTSFLQSILSFHYHQPSLYHCSWFRLFIFRRRRPRASVFYLVFSSFLLLLLTYGSLHMKSSLLHHHFFIMSYHLPYALSSRSGLDSFHITYDK